MFSVSARQVFLHFTGHWVSVYPVSVYLVYVYPVSGTRGFYNGLGRDAQTDGQVTCFLANCHLKVVLALYKKELNMQKYFGI